METNASTVIRKAVPEDVGTIFKFICDLAAYEKLRHEVSTDEATLRSSLFGENAVAYVLIAEKNAHPVGFCLYFYNFSTFLGRKGLYIEDIYVDPHYRGDGIGKQLLEYLAQIAINEKCGRMEWWVLDWNTPAIKFYEKLGATAMKDWTVYRLDEKQFTALSMPQKNSGNSI
jgi:GNAT superfamily N-acetyltransferase